MKRILSLLTAISISGSLPITLVSCNAQRSVMSLDDSSNDILAKDHSFSYHDITYWSSDAINSDAYKNGFINNLTNAIKDGGKQVDYNEFVKNDGSGQAIVFKLLAAYEASSNTGSEIKKYSDIKVLENDFNTIIYDQDNKATAEFKDGSWVNVPDHGQIKAEYKADTKVYVVTFSIQIDVSTKGRADKFVGTRRNIIGTNNKDESKWTDITGAFASDQTSTNLLVDSSDSHFNKGKILKNNKWYMTNSYDYRYKVQFYFSLA
ncbi:hypothetical protein [Spiroplasma eriocheiris]|uniref:Lipoprotein n=1 Tax=Spiroplasma eriocheiris TaxID=315358 RepID=A0A0H3XHC5_9MOLU|nr:hypothetical protein [Spiroplasma eriocheiris]AHF57193.1 hypothetical protein SPE_0057 [Spiroplasma eriocheiris CCTCC M 207170]AKM53660.1 hypothetical protein SERIO_v1c00580 [Spiroplasma eriocheiris]